MRCRSVRRRTETGDRRLETGERRGSESQKCVEIWTWFGKNTKLGKSEKEGTVKFKEQFVKSNVHGQFVAF